MADKRIFLPVKIMDKQWTDKLLNGSVFMRSLHDFGSWNLDARVQQTMNEIDNDFRGDIGEGIIRNIDPKLGDDFFNSLVPQFRSAILNAYYIDQDLFQYYKVYCMYCLTYNLDRREFEKPDKRLQEFGDTAILIHNPSAFLNRILKSLLNRFGDNINFDFREVYYYDLSKDFGSFDMFCKTESYRWQNEIRMSVGLLDENQTKRDEKGHIYKALMQNIDPLILEIGSIRDIAMEISIRDFLALDFPIRLP